MMGVRVGFHKCKGRRRLGICGDGRILTVLVRGPRKRTGASVNSQPQGSAVLFYFCNNSCREIGAFCQGEAVWFHCRAIGEDDISQHRKQIRKLVRILPRMEPVVWQSRCRLPGRRQEAHRKVRSVVFSCVISSLCIDNIIDLRVYSQSREYLLCDL